MKDSPRRRPAFLLAFLSGIILIWKSQALFGGDAPWYSAEWGIVRYIVCLFGIAAGLTAFAGSRRWTTPWKIAICLMASQWIMLAFSGGFTMPLFLLVSTGFLVLFGFAALAGALMMWGSLKAMDEQAREDAKDIREGLSR